MWELNHKEHRRIDAFELWCWRRLFRVFSEAYSKEQDSKEIKPVNPKGNQPCMFIGRTDAEAPILWPPDTKSQLSRKDPVAGKGWGQEEKGATEDEMAGWYNWLRGHKFEQTPRDSEGQGSLACCDRGVAKILTWLSNWITIMQGQRGGEQTKKTRVYPAAFHPSCWGTLFTDNSQHFHAPL